MLAIHLTDKAQLQELPRPAPAPGEVLIRVRLAGVCRTDLEVLEGYRGFRGVMGHEFVGEVAGPEDTPWLGRRVAGEINVGCGRCDRCRRGLSRHCAARQVIGLKGRDGAFAQYLTLPAANLHAIPPQVPDEAAVFTEPLAAALRVQEVASFTPDSRVLVVGDGALGLLISWILALQGSEVHLVGHYAEHLALAQPYGVITCLEKDLAAGNFEAVVEASGSPRGLELALDRVLPLGTVVLKSTYTGRFSLDPASLVVPEVRLVGSRCGPFPTALRLLSQERLDPRPLIQRCFSLSQGLAALAYARQAGVLKVIIAIDD